MILTYLFGKHEISEFCFCLLAEMRTKINKGNCVKIIDILSIK